MPVCNEVEAFVGRVILQPHPILQCAEIMADVQPPRGPHSAQNPTLLFFNLCCHFGSQTVFTQKQISRFARTDNCSSPLQREPPHGSAPSPHPHHLYPPPPPTPPL